MQPSVKSEKELFFLSFCVEAFKMRHHMQGGAVLALFDRLGVTQYLTDHFEVLHTQGEKWIIDDIDKFIETRS